jgi:hypothetical protein
MNWLKNIKAWQWALLVGVMALSFGVWYYLYLEQLTMVYNDAKSYMNISRAVIDNQQPGLAQIGSVWLPLTHLVKIPLIWNDWAWHSGFAGSFISMLSYVAAVVGVYLIALRLTGVRLAAIVAGAAMALNANLLYLQSTALTEPLYLGFFVWSIFFLMMYIKTSALKYMLPLAFMISLQIMIRYDGWFMAAVIASILFIHELWVRRFSLAKVVGQVLLFATPVAFTCLLWFGWNAIIFDDPFYFATGPYSAHSQQELIAESASGLITKGSILTSIKAYWFAVVGNVGWLVLGAGLAGWLVYIFTSKYKAWRVPLMVLGGLAGVFIFNVLALFLGFSIINVPELNWGGTSTVEPLFNVRYGVLTLPLVAVGVGLLVAKWRYAAIIVISLVAFQGVAMVQEKPITLRDGLSGSSAFTQRGLAQSMKDSIKAQDEVLLSIGTFNPVVFESGIQLSQIVHEGVQYRWPEMLSDPAPSIRWIVMGVDNSDAVRKNLYNTAVLENNYRLVYQDEHGSLYQLVPQVTAAN